MEIFSKQVNKIGKGYSKPSSVNATLEGGWKKALRCIFAHMRKEEVDLNISHSGSALNKLHTKSMDVEQIWQQLELQNQLLLSMADSLEPESLWYKVTNLCTQVEKETTEDADKESSDEGVESGEDFEDEELEDNEEEVDDEGESHINDDENNHDVSNDVNDDDSLDSTLDASDLDIKTDLDNLNDSDFDADTFGDIAPEGADSEADSVIGDEGEMVEGTESDDEVRVKVQKETQSSKKFGRTQVDTQFLNLRESEWVADNDLIGNHDSDSEGIDYMEDIDGSMSDEELGKQAMYGDFFDPPRDAEPIDEATEEIKSKSTYEKQVEKEKEIIQNLEQENMSERPWFLKGEVQKDQRPENSALEEDLSSTIAVRPKPIISDDIMCQLERIVLSRINTCAWDDVERKIKPNVDPLQYKKSLILDQEKSKKSLAEIYEEEYLKLQGKGTKPSGQSGPSVILGQKVAPEDEPPEHKKIKDSMDDLFMKLNALSNYHYTPRASNAELKIVSNLPAISLEETTPAATSDAALLAPEEVVVPLRGDPKGKSEKTLTDKKRERRSKKSHQKQRAKLQDQKLKGQVKKRTMDGGLPSTNDSIKLVQKALKKGQVKVLDSQQQPAVKSSIAFFQQLQENVKVASKRKSEAKQGPMVKKRKLKPQSGLSASKLLL